MSAHLRALSILPLLPPLWIIFQLASNDLGIGRTADDAAADGAAMTSVGAQLLVFLVLGIVGYVGTVKLVPNIKHYMKRRQLCGKDLGKKGTKSENDDM